MPKSFRRSRYVPKGVRAFGHYFQNATPFDIVVKAKYGSYLCKDDTFTLSSGDEKKIGAGACAVTGVSAVVKEEPGILCAPQQEIRQRRDVPTTENYSSTYSGDSAWIIYGPRWVNNRYVYGVTRKVT